MGLHLRVLCVFMLHSWASKILGVRTGNVIAMATTSLCLLLFWEDSHSLIVIKHCEEKNNGKKIGWRATVLYTLLIILCRNCLGGLIICFCFVFLNARPNVLFYFWLINQLKLKLNKAHSQTFLSIIGVRLGAIWLLFCLTCQLRSCHYSLPSKCVILALSALRDILKSAFNNRELDCLDITAGGATSIFQ